MVGTDWVSKSFKDPNKEGRYLNAVLLKVSRSSGRSGMEKFRILMWKSCKAVTNVSFENRVEERSVCLSCTAVQPLGNVRLQWPEITFHAGETGVVGSWVTAHLRVSVVGLLTLKCHEPSSSTGKK